MAANVAQHDFGAALRLMKQGKRLTREAWAKGAFMVVMPSLYLPPHSSQEPGAKVNDRTAKHIGEDTPLDSQPYFAMLKANKQWQPGVVPAVDDLLALDWQLADGETYADRSEL